MREIKFRAWDKKRRSMVFNSIDLLSAILSEAIRNYILKDLVFMQYTGLKDKHGVELYEGDIVKYDTQRVVEITWHKQEACFDAVAINSAGEPREVCERYLKTSEVIGNIYENEELL